MHRSMHNKERKSKPILLMIIDGKKWHYLTVKKTVGGFYCLLFSFT